MKLVEIKVRRFKELITGILLENGTRWSFIRLNVVDYVLDGFQITNKRYISDIYDIKEDTLQYKILSIKNRTKDILPKLYPDTLDDDNLLCSFLKEKNLLIAVCLHREDVLYVGKVKEVNSNFFTLDSYDTELRKSGIIKIEYSKVRYIQMHTDYLDSLCLILNKDNGNVK
ncbi:MAG: hypothetical protein J5676_01210 [Bacteroidaceae bacterium]|nr:hypothetical protein [Bacteroidaceae bacterium]